MKESGDWKEDSSPMGLPKIGHRKVSVGKKVKEKKEEGAEGESTETETEAKAK